MPERIDSCPKRCPPKSFVKRQGRITCGQRRALVDFGPRYLVGAESDLELDLEAVFARVAPKLVEIGFGMGDGLVESAGRFPDADFLGIEVYRPGIGRCMKLAAEAGLDNLRIIEGDAAEVLRSRILPATVDKILVYFPDPWPKKRHHKRRLVQAEFVESVLRVMKVGGELCLATDWRDYAEQMLRVLDAARPLENLAGPGRFHARPDLRPLTKFEQRGMSLGHEVWDLIYRHRGC